MAEFQAVLIRARDTVGGELPLIVSSLNSNLDFENGTTFGRLLRLRRNDNNTLFFDIGIDLQGNLFVNSNAVDSPHEHLLTISPTGDVTIRGSLRVGGSLSHG
jgi:hypothetical protein